MVKVSARNLLRGRVKQVTLGTVHAEVVVEIAPTCDLTATITRSSSEQLGLQPGKQVYAVIKSSNIMIAE
jgi:molybdopterin-binding protein